MICDTDMYALAQQLGLALQARSLRMVLTESCTGGWLAKCVTDVPGSSEWFDQGFVTYSNASKQSQLEVNAGTLETHGAVSEQVVREMVSGGLSRSQAEIAVAVSGIAGPGGGSDEKAVGMVWFAWGMRKFGIENIETLLQHFSGNREAIRRQAVMAALEGVLKFVESAMPAH